MSLFKTRPFWTTTCEDDEEFDQNSLITTRLNTESDFIFTGSHNGVLRVFKPSSDFTDTNSLSGYKVTDLLIEKSFASPILQLGCGRLVSGTTKVHLAILHPRSMGVYTLLTKEGATDHGTQNMLQLLYEHKIRRSAANFVLGPFGGTQNRDFTCIQSLDGVLFFYEQESFAFCCFLPDFLIVSPIVYIKQSDCFLTCNSLWQMTGYKYKSLSEIGHNTTEADDSGKTFKADWTSNLGETVLDLEVVDDVNAKETCIMVLGERNLYCINDVGKLKFMKKLDYLPVCFMNYALNGNVMSVVVSETSTILFYEQTALKWSAKTEILPIALRRAYLRNISGSLILLSEDGRLECCYLGTEPSLYTAPPLADQDIDFDKAGLELATLNKIIKSARSNDITSTNASAERELAVTVTVSSQLEICTFDRNINNASCNNMCAISIDIVPQAVFEEVQIAVMTQRPLKIAPPVAYFNNLVERTSVECYAFVDEAAEVASLNVQVVVSFISNLGVPRSITKWAMLPPSLVLETCAPHKDNEHKITLNINHPPVGLSNLFPEFDGQNSVITSNNTIGFRNITGAGSVVSILLAKSSERYRLQSNSLSSLSLLVEQMVFRLQKRFSNTDNFSVSFNSPLPISETLLYAKNHFVCRQKYNKLQVMRHGPECTQMTIKFQDELTQLSAQFRLIQKRLISKFKVKNPTPLTDLKLLLEDTFSEITKSTENLQNEAENLVRAQIELSCALQLLLNLIKLMDVNNNVAALVKSTLCSNIYDLDGQNWEDVLDASLCFLLRTTLAKTEKDKLRAAHTAFDEVKDILKVEKHFSQVLERVVKGSGSEETHVTIDEEKDEIADELEDLAPQSIPIGSQIGQASSRLLSARKRLARNPQKIDE